MDNSVKLVAITKPVIEECADAQELIAYCARVSNPTNQANHKTSGKLLNYLLQHKHWSPLEMCSMVLEIQCTRDIGRQILRHRSFSFQEFSQRYAEVDERSFSLRECRLQDTKNRQNSVETNDQELVVKWEEMQTLHQQRAIRSYAWALDNGIAKEQARAILPEGMTMSRMYMAGTIRSWVHYCELRMGNGTQKEHADIAKGCWGILCEQFPAIPEALQEGGLV